jgi:hypothetical protein
VTEYEAGFKAAIKGLTKKQKDALIVVSSSDDEGNSFGPVHFAPGLGHHSGYEFQGVSDSPDITPNALCIN